AIRATLTLVSVTALTTSSSRSVSSRRISLSSLMWPSSEANSRCISSLSALSSSRASSRLPQNVSTASHNPNKAPMILSACCSSTSGLQHAGVGGGLAHSCHDAGEQDAHECNGLGRRQQLLNRPFAGYQLNELDVDLGEERPADY